MEKGKFSILIRPWTKATGQGGTESFAPSILQLFLSLSRACPAHVLHLLSMDVLQSLV